MINYIGIAKIYLQTKLLFLLNHDIIIIEIFMKYVICKQWSILANFTLQQSFQKNSLISQI